MISGGNPETLDYEGYTVIEKFRPYKFLTEFIRPNRTIDLRKFDLSYEHFGRLLKTVHSDLL